MYTKNIVFKGLTALMIVVFLRMPLSQINSHTYTVGVSNGRDWNCVMCCLENTRLEFIELKEFNSN